MEDLTISQSREPKSLGMTLWLRLRAAFSGVNIHRSQRRLKLCETLSLGDNRIIALVEYENQRFLIAATPQNICLLPTPNAPTGESATTDRQ